MRFVARLRRQGPVQGCYEAGPCGFEWQRTRGGITTTGNAHLRRVLVEAAWPYRHHPFAGPALTARPRGAPAPLIQTAWPAQSRVHRRDRRLAARGTPKHVIVTAVARELTGFLWAVLTQ
jgi:transposase